MTDGSPAQSIEGWATNIVAGAAAEAGQVLHFVVTTDRQDLFVEQPTIDSTGKLTFTPAANVEGSAQITIELKDDGGTANGGLDTSDSQTFTIYVTKRHRWHNTLNGLDASGDGEVAPNDALTVINYINDFGAGPVPSAAQLGSPFYDVNADDVMAPNDALDVINYLNAFGSTVPGSAAGEGEAAGTLAHGENLEADWLSLLAMDVAAQAKRRRM